MCNFYPECSYACTLVFMLGYKPVPSSRTLTYCLVNVLLIKQMSVKIFCLFTNLCRIIFVPASTNVFREWFIYL